MRGAQILFSLRCLLPPSRRSSRPRHRGGESRMHSRDPVRLREGSAWNPGTNSPSEKFFPAESLVSSCSSGPLGRRIHQPYQRVFCARRYLSIRSEASAAGPRFRVRRTNTVRFQKGCKMIKAGCLRFIQRHPAFICTFLCFLILFLSFFFLFSSFFRFRPYRRPSSSSAFARALAITASIS